MITVDDRPTTDTDTGSTRPDAGAATDVSGHTSRPLPVCIAYALVTVGGAWFLGALITLFALVLR